MNYNTILPPFKWFVLQNFPYIEDDFDALTNWQLFCKLGKEMNKIIEKCNLTGEQVENLTNAYNELKAYVDDYFENLDVQEEVNNKLDEMAESGELADLIAQYLESQAIIGFNNNTSLASATNLANGSFARTYGKINYNDGKGAFYKIRTRTNADDPDGDTLIALTNTENLVAEMIPYSRTSTLHDEIEELKQKKTMIVIGDSYSSSSQSGTPLWYTYVSNALNLNVYTNAGDGQGYGTGNNNFLVQLQTANEYFTDKSIIDRIYIMGGLNDLGNTTGVDATIFNQKVTETLEYAVTNFPNIPIYVYGIMPFQFYNFYSGSTYLPAKRATIFSEILSYCCMRQPNVFFTSCSSFGLFCPDYFGNVNGSNQRHPSATGERAIANLVLTGQHFYGIRNINQNPNQCPTLATEIAITQGTATSVQIVGTDLNYIYLRVNGYQNSTNLQLDLSRLPIEINNDTTQYQFLVTDQSKTILGWISRNANFNIPANSLNNGTLYINIPYNPNW